jgi:hypothetical protein
MADVWLIYQSTFKLAIHHMFTLRENILLLTKRMRKYELEPVLAVYFAAVADSDNKHNQTRVFDLIQNSVIAHSYSKDLVCATELLRIRRAGVLAKGKDLCVDPSQDGTR